MDYSVYCLLLLLLSIALLVIEIFLPSGGFLGLMMLASLIGSIVCGYFAWWETSRGIWWFYIGSVVVLLPTVLIGAFALIPKTSFGRRILLDAPQSDEITPYAKERSELHELVGASGSAMTPHRPSGMVNIQGRRYHAETRGMMLEAGDPVTVVEVRGNRLVVRLVEESRAAATSTESEPAENPPKSEEIKERRPETRTDEAFDPFLDEAGPRSDA